MNEDNVNEGNGEDWFDVDSGAINSDSDDGVQIIDEDEQTLDVDDLFYDIIGKPLMDRRDRLKHPQCEDEPSDRVYQHFLSGIYKQMNQRKRLRMSLFQKVRTEHLIGKYCESQKMFALAADHYRRGAEVAEQISDLALLVQLKYRESLACGCPDPHASTQFYRAFETARIAWEAWRRLPNRDITEDVYFEFKLADNIGRCAVTVAEYVIAADGMERAGVLLHRLRDRPDFNPKRYANIDLFLTWDWVTVSIGKGDYRDAFKRILQTRRKGRDLLKPINRVRLQWLIALITLGCAEQIPTTGRTHKGYTRQRLLAVAAKAIDDANNALKDCEDERGRALTLLADAKLLGMLGIKEGRLDRIKEAAAIAATLNDRILLGRVKIGWGDEFVFQRNNREAKSLYRNVEQEMTQLEYFDLANMARQRLARLNAPTRRKSPQKHSGSSGSPPNSPNEPPPDDKLPLN